ncbi:hypothetical protein [Citricoccus muralis]|uniref:Uncharacterized protein n=1 Tax=Citricoccus muralis TaxID=169134 RepID=A0ABY8H4M8_9MICC|nr:hypothetical protein [Citricoccus muralis]WFP16101.1 hypothetical protein P8192_11980 [Citricoccus muralis]
MTAPSNPGSTPGLTVGPRWARAALLWVPAVWLGLMIGISLIEAPLKFTAPGITIPLGLGIGRRVFLAMNLTELALAVVLIAALVVLWRGAAAWPSTRGRWWYLGALAVLAVKSAVIRPLLASHTDAVLAGVSDGGSGMHYAYIAADALLIVLLVTALVLGVKRILAPEVAPGK